MFGPNSIGSMSIPTLFRQGGTSGSGSSVENKFAISLDGVDQTVRFIGSPAAATAFADVNADNQFTFNIWFRIADIDANANTEIWNMGTTTNYTRVFVSGSGTSINFYAANGGPVILTSAPITISDDTWHMFTVTSTRSTNWSTSLYLDGRALALSLNYNDSGDVIETGSMFLGKLLGSANYDPVDIDEMSLFKTEISAANVLYMYNNLIDLTTWGDVGLGKLMWWYRFENNTEDSAENYADGTEINDPTYLSAVSETLPYNS